MSRSAPRRSAMSARRTRWASWRHSPMTTEGDAPVSTSELMAAEDAGWDELHALMDTLTAEEAERPGYYPEGWSAKDLLAHIGSWLAEAGVLLERISVGTYRREENGGGATNPGVFGFRRGGALPTGRGLGPAGGARPPPGYA